MTESGRKARHQWPVVLWLLASCGAEERGPDAGGPAAPIDLAGHCEQLANAYAEREARCNGGEAREYRAMFEV